MFTVQGNKTVRLANALPSLLSPEVDRLLLGSLGAGTSSGSVHFCRLNFVVVWCFFFKKMQPTNQNNPLSQTHFPPLCLLTREMESSVAFVSERGHRKYPAARVALPFSAKVSGSWMYVHHRARLWCLAWRKKRPLLRSLSRYLSQAVGFLSKTSSPSCSPAF